MYTKQPKKLLIFNILDILKKYSDADHRLSQKEIEDILKAEYNMVTDRKAIKRNLMNLIDFGYEIEYSEYVRMVPNAKTGEREESCVLSDFYLVREFTDGELRLLIDSLLFPIMFRPVNVKNLSASSKDCQVLISVPGSSILQPFRTIRQTISRSFSMWKFWTRRFPDTER